MRLLIAVLGLACLTAPIPAYAQPGPPPDRASDRADLHAGWARLLTLYLREDAQGANRFDYQALRETQADREALDAYIAGLEAIDPDTLSRDEAFAFWANLYNAVTVRLIVEEDPQDSIREIRPHLFAAGPWGMELVTVAGQALSLDAIEHDIMRERYEAALVHYAVNCASISCPDLQPEPWRGETLDADLEEAARGYINDPRGVTVTGQGLRVSRIYRWYREDFGGDEAGVIDHLLDYARPELAARIRSNPQISGHAYDWSLNRPEDQAG